MAKVGDAGYLTLSLGAAVIACGTSVSADLTRDTRDTTCKGASGYKTFEPSFGSGSISFEGLIDVETDNFAGLLTAFKTPNTLIAWSIAYDDGTTTVSYLDGNAYMTSLALSAGNAGENATYSGTLTITGEVNPA